MGPERPHWLELGETPGAHAGSLPGLLSRRPTRSVLGPGPGTRPADTKYHRLNSSSKGLERNLLPVVSPWSAHTAWRRRGQTLNVTLACNAPECDHSLDIHNKIRNCLGVEKAAKLVFCYRMLRGKEYLYY